MVDLTLKKEREKKVLYSKNSKCAKCEKSILHSFASSVKKEKVKTFSHLKAVITTHISCARDISRYKNMFIDLIIYKVIIQYDYVVW